MTIRVEIAGKGVAEFPDGTPEAVIHLAVQRDYFGREPSISEKAAARLGEQGLTLDQIKADPSVVHSAPTPSVADEMMATGTQQLRGGGEGLLDTGIGLAKQSAMAALGPVALAVTSPGQVEGMANDIQARMANADTRYANDPARRAVSKTLAVASPLGGGLISDLIDPAMQATAGRQVTPEEFRASGNAGTQLGAMAASGPIAKSIVGEGAGIAESAQGNWNRAVSTPRTAQLVESIGPKLMDAMGVVNDAAGISKTAEAARNAIPKPKGTLGQPLAPDQSALLQNREFQANIQKVADALAETNPSKVGNVLMEGLEKATKRGVGTYIVEKMLDAATGGVASKVVAGLQIAKTALVDLPKTVAFKTASAVAKKSFGQALQSGDLLTASQLGAAIASGMAAEDAFGHRKAVQALSEETAQYQSPDQKRQVVAAKKWVYVDPKGGEVPIPQNVMTAFANSPKLTETQSPVQAYVDAMIRQGNLTKGGRIEFR